MDEIKAISVELFQHGYLVKLNVDVYLHLWSSVLFPINKKKLNNWNSEKAYLVVCGRLLVICGGLWSLHVLVTTRTNLSEKIEYKCVKKSVWFSPFYITDRNKFQWFFSSLLTISHYFQDIMIRFGSIKVHFWKNNNLFKDKKLQHDRKNTIFHYFCSVLSEREKVLNFRILPKRLCHADYLVNFELLPREICNLQFLSTDLNFTKKTKTKDIVLFSFCTYDNNLPQHLSKPFW